MAQKKAHEVDSFLACPSQGYSIILIYGTNRGLVSERATLFAKKTGVNLCDPFASICLEAAEIDQDPARLVDEAKTVTLFGEKRLLWVRNAGLQKGLSKAVEWLFQDIPNKVFILIEAGELKKNAALRNLIELAPSGIALPCYDDEQSTLDHVINAVLEQFSLRITPDARAILHKNIGIDRLATRGELEKLCFYAKGRKIINSDDVLQVVSDMGKSSQDEVVDAVISGNLVTFDAAYDRQIGNSHLILTAVQRQFQQLQEMRFIMEDEKRSAQYVLSCFYPSIFFRRRKIIEQALLCWSVEKLARIMEKLCIIILESRRKSELASIIIRQNLMTLTYETSILRRKEGCMIF